MTTNTFHVNETSSNDSTRPTPPIYHTGTVTPHILTERVIESKPKRKRNVKIIETDQIAKNLAQVETNYNKDEVDLQRIPSTSALKRSDSAASSFLGISKNFPPRPTGVGGREQVKKLIRRTFKKIKAMKEQSKKTKALSASADKKKNKVTLKIHERELINAGTPPDYQEHETVYDVISDYNSADGESLPSYFAV